jgi:hypothetical protein
VKSRPKALPRTSLTPRSSISCTSHSTASIGSRNAGISDVDSPPTYSSFSYTVTFLYPSRARKVAAETEAGPQPTMAIASSYDAVPGACVALTFIALNVSTAKCCKPPMLIAPPSVAAALQPPTQRSEVGQTMPQERPTGLSDRICFAAP